MGTLMKLFPLAESNDLVATGHHKLRCRGNKPSKRPDCPDNTLKLENHPRPSATCRYLNCQVIYSYLVTATELDYGCKPLDQKRIESTRNSWYKTPVLSDSAEARHLFSNNRL